MVFWETAQEACNRVVTDIKEAESTVLGLGAIPCFCTVAPMSLRAWNTTRLHQRKTTHLKHSQHYLGPSSEHPDYTQNMQVELENATTLINQKIYKINENNEMYTPKIAEQIFKSPQANRAPRMRYSKFVDGVHPDPLVSLCWAEPRRSWVPSSATDTKIQNKYTVFHALTPPPPPMKTKIKLLKPWSICISIFSAYRLIK